MGLRSLGKAGFTVGVAANAPAVIPAPASGAQVADKASQGGNVVEFERKIKVTNDNGTGTIYVKVGPPSMGNATVADTPVNPNNPVVIVLGFNETFYSVIGSAAAMPGTIELVTGRNE